MLDDIRIEKTGYLRQWAREGCRIQADTYLCAKVAMAFSPYVLHSAIAAHSRTAIADRT